MPEIYYGRGKAEMFDEYVDFLNYVFGFNGNKDDFKKLLPKLYNPEYDPVSKSWIVTEDQKLKAAVGVYETKSDICGTELRIAGVGNVAVHPYARSKGYMKTLMNMAIDEMIKEKYDYSVLSGLRQRYNYFSYEKTGICYDFLITSNNIRHVFHNRENACGLQMELVKKDDTEALDVIAEMCCARTFAPVRPRKDLYNILCSWEARPYVFKENGKITGYCVLENDQITEIYVEQTDRLLDAIRLFVAEKEAVHVVLPEYLTEYIDILEEIAEVSRLQSDKMFFIISFRRVIKAFLRLKSSYTTLADGEFTVLIHGRAGDEKLYIYMKNQEVHVEACSAADEKEPELELSHLEATRFFFAPVFAKRRSMPHFVQNWLPLPLWLHSADNV